MKQTLPVPVVDAKGGMQTIQIQLQPQATPAAATGAPPQLSFLTPVAVLPQDPLAIVTPISAAPPGTLKVLPPPDSLAMPVSTTTGGAVSMVVASSSKSPNTLASILPKHPVPQSQLVVTAPAPTQGHSSLPAPSKSVPEQLAQLKPVAQVRPVPLKAPTAATATTTIKHVSPPRLPTQPINTIILPSKPVAPAPPTPPSTTVVILNSNGAVVGNGTTPAATNGHQPHSAINGNATTTSTAPTTISNNNSSSSNNGSGQACPSGVIAKTRAELSSCGTSMLRPEAAAHKVHNASRKPKEKVIEELWQHYLACHAAELTSPTSIRSHPKKVAVKTESSPPQVKQEVSSATSTAAAESTITPPKKRPRLTPPQPPVQRTTIAHVAEVAAAAAEGWVGKVAEDDDDEANN